VPADELLRFQSFLAQRGLKWTRQREAIALVLFRGESHLSLDQVLAEARSSVPSVGYATVYRTMKLLAESGLASEHRFSEGGVASYEMARDHHDHLICVSCGKVFEYEDLEVEERQAMTAKRLGFRVVSHRHEIYGECERESCPERPSVSPGVR
jgi:Fur family ferric uptake transcriptional regulator